MPPWNRDGMQWRDKQQASGIPHYFIVQVRARPLHPYGRKPNNALISSPCPHQRTILRQVPKRGNGARPRPCPLLYPMDAWHTMSAGILSHAQWITPRSKAANTPAQSSVPPFSGAPIRGQGPVAPVRRRRRSRQATSAWWTASHATTALPYKERWTEGRRLGALPFRRHHPPATGGRSANPVSPGRRDAPSPQIARRLGEESLRASDRSPRGRAPGLPVRRRAPGEYVLALLPVQLPRLFHRIPISCCNDIDQRVRNPQR